MSKIGLRSPKNGDPGRDRFEKAYKEGDEVIVAQFRVDTALRQIYTHIAKNDFDETDLAEVESVVEAGFGKALKSTSYETTSDIIHYYHLKIKHALAKQIVYTQFAFAKKERFELRRQIVDGTYGTIAEILEDALTKYDSAYDPDEKARLTGIINELTVLALLNRRQVPERIAIPSDITSDLYEATDIDYFVLRGTMSTFRPYSIQVKTGGSPANLSKAPAGGVIVAAEHMCNQQYRDIRFPTSRAIVADINATETAEQAEYLGWAIERFDTHIKLGTLEADKFFDALAALPREIRRGAVQAFKHIIDKAMDENPDATGLDITLHPRDD